MDKNPGKVPAGTEYDFSYLYMFTTLKDLNFLVILT
uniref:Uncharacterized protein n=1 Tax=Arundo donax TaxID=35708 RepID=A0A0A9GKR3_ARUDO